MRPERWVLLVLAGALGLGPLAGAARAQAGAAAQFDAQTFRPDPDGLGSLGVPSTRTLRPGLLVLGTFASYAMDPVVDSAASAGSTDVTTDLSTLDLLATIGLTEGWEAGLDVPVSLIRNVAFAKDQGSFTAGLGDIQLFTKWAPLSRDRGPFGLALEARLGLPTGDEGNFLGAGGVTADGGVVADGKVGPVAAALRLGYLFRDAGETLGDALGFKAALVYEGEANAFRPLVELHGSTPFDNFGDEQSSPLEAIVGFRWDIPFAGLMARGGPMQGLVLSSGIGFGLNDGLGSPTARGILGLTALTGAAPSAQQRSSRIEVPQRPAEPDADRDGIPDAVDLCPERAETRNGHLDLDGCPEVGAPPPPAPPVLDALPVEPPSASVPAPVQVRGDARVGGPSTRFEAIRFESDGLSLAPEASRTLDRLYDVLVRDPGLRVELVGHADASGAPERNVMLSIERAVRIEEWLVARGIDRRRVQALGVGDVQPIATNATPEGRALNRRVEIRLEGGR